MLEVCIGNGNLASVPILFSLGNLVGIGMRMVWFGIKLVAEIVR